jgi:hypothetical protein
MEPRGWRSRVKDRARISLKAFDLVNERPGCVFTMGSVAFDGALLVTRKLMLQMLYPETSNERFEYAPGPQGQHHDSKRDPGLGLAFNSSNPAEPEQDFPGCQGHPTQKERQM